MSEQMSILNVKDGSGNWISVPGLKGEKGDPGEGITVTDINNDGNVVISFE